jgi:hypothetical protein
MMVEYDCGHVYTVPLVLRENQTLLANAALGDQMLRMIDATHDEEHPECHDVPD